MSFQVKSLVVILALLFSAAPFTGVCAQEKQSSVPDAPSKEKSPVIVNIPIMEKEMKTDEASATQPSDDDPFYKFGDIVITVKDFKSEVDKLPVKNSDYKLDLLNTWVNREILYREAVKQGFDKKLEAQVAAVTDPNELKKIIVDAFKKEVIEKDISVTTDDEAKSYYEKTIDNFMPPTMYTITILSVQKFDRSYKDITQRAGQEAELIRERLLKGEDPDTIRASYDNSEVLVQRTLKTSISKNTKYLCKEISEALPEYKTGTISPVCELGRNRFDVLKVLDVSTPKETRTFEQAKESIINHLKELKIRAKEQEYWGAFAKDNRPVVYRKDLLK